MLFFSHFNHNLLPNSKSNGHSSALTRFDLLTQSVLPWMYFLHLASITPYSWFSPNNVVNLNLPCWKVFFNSHLNGWFILPFAQTKILASFHFSPLLSHPHSICWKSYCYILKYIQKPITSQNFHFYHLNTKAPLLLW